MHPPDIYRTPRRASRRLEMVSLMNGISRNGTLEDPSNLISVAPENRVDCVDIEGTRSQTDAAVPGHSHIRLELTEDGKDRLGNLLGNLPRSQEGGTYVNHLRIVSFRKHSFY